ncbi:hypothetical protein [Candidatus Parabeggiatoa sp. HSG14]|uniref:hypothetical protein n=1 Tax=Candidatus Parabeggiatoa sp. HSG14 TaxID=3055593 RepID=UPI0025A76B0B|nr:hypothetical protein [Thiotrichales bacterium HSG14]
MKYLYLSGFPNYPIADFDHLLDAYEHIGEEIYAQALTFIGRIHGSLHRVELKPFTFVECKDETVYYPYITQLQIGETVDVVTNSETFLLAG